MPEIGPSEPKAEPTDGRIRVEAPTTTPGDYIRLHALEDLIIGLTACSAYDSCGGTFKPIQYEIESGG